MTAAGETRRAGSGRRLRRIVGIAGAVVVAAWLAGRGLMLVGHEPAPGGGTPAAMTADAPAATPQAAETNLPDPPDRTDRASASPRLPESSPAAQPPPTATDEAAPGIEADRFATLCSAITVHLDRGELAAAAKALAHVASMPLDMAQRGVVDAAEGDLRQAAGRQLQVVAAAIAAGRGRAAAAAFVPLAALADEPVAWLADLVAATGLAAWRRGEPAPDSALPAPRPLARGRSVTAQGTDGELRGVVVAADPADCTLRVERPTGIAFPSVPLVACEPEDPTAAEAVELALAAARQGDVLLARAWAHIADLRGGGDMPRLRRVVAALP